MLWVGSGHGKEDLYSLQEDLAQQLDLAGWPKETRKFSGHLTLCRIRSSKAGLKLARAGEEYKDLKLGNIAADSLSIYQSQLTPTGPIYTRLANYKLL